jgi:pimeloyl-ACP methyl ester carboxylesterase
MSSGPVRRSVRLSERGVELAVLEWDGPGPLALLSHATGFCGAMWGEVAQVLRAGYRVVAYDARGHGDSSKPAPPAAYDWQACALDLIALAEQLQTESQGERGAVYAIGHSFGGTATLGAAAQRPDLFARIGLVDPVLMPRVHNAPSRMSENARRRRAEWPSRDALRETWRERSLFADWTPTAFETYVREGTRERADGSVELKCPPEVEAAVFENAGSIDVAAAASALRIPALLLFALRGEFRREWAEALEKRAASLRIEDMDAGHLLPMEVPDELGRRLLDFGRA